MALNNYSYKVFYRDIKYPRVELKTGKLLFVLPFGYKPNVIYKRNKSWINKKIGFIEECLDNSKNKNLIERSNEEFKNLVCSFTNRISEDLKVEINQIYFRKMKTKWASLSSFKNLTVNRLMEHLPKYLIGYIIFHELVHTIEKKHNNKFWNIVKERYKNYNELEKELFEYWFRVLWKSDL